MSVGDTTYEYNRNPVITMRRNKNSHKAGIKNNPTKLVPVYSSRNLQEQEKVTKTSKGYFSCFGK